MKAEISVTTILVIFVVALILSVVRFAKARSSDLPTFSKEVISQEEGVAAFVYDFFASDSQARQLLSASNKTLFAEGHRPQIGLVNDPEIKGKKYSDIQTYFTRKLYLDLRSLGSVDVTTFRAFVDQIGHYSDETITCAGEIAFKYKLNVQGRFSFQTELAKVPVGKEREQFKRCWLNDAILGTELRMLAWIYQELFKVRYVNPHNRSN